MDSESSPDLVYGAESPVRPLSAMAREERRRKKTELGIDTDALSPSSSTMSSPIKSANSPQREARRRQKTLQQALQLETQNSKSQESVTEQQQLANSQQGSTAAVEGNKRKRRSKGATQSSEALKRIL